MDRLSGSTSAIRLAPGTVIDGRYEIGEVLGTGGYAVVYEATQLNIGRRVAIKVLTAFPEHRERIERFLREARAAARIRHPNAVVVHDVGELDEGPPYMVMEPFVGHDLKAHLRFYGAMEPGRLLPLFVDALDALATAHEQGVIHRDLKPSNLVLCEPDTEREQLKIIDFGIARLKDEAVDLTGSKLLGTPAYLAPEYIRDRTVTPAMDVYQMGLILVELLTGKKAADGENAYSCMFQHISGELVVPPELHQTPVGTIIDKAIARNPEDRYPNAAALREALEQVDPTLVVLPTQRYHDTMVEGPAFDPAACDEGNSEAFTPGQTTLFTASGVDRKPAVPPEADEPTSSTALPALLLVGIAGAVVILVSLTLLLVIVAVQSGPGEPPGAPRLAVTKGEVEPSRGLTASVDGTGEPSSDSATPDDEVAKQRPFRRIPLVAMPKEAEIREDDEVLAIGSTTLTFATKNAPDRTLLVRAEGFDDQIVKVGPEFAGDAVKVELVPSRDRELAEAETRGETKRPRRRAPRRPGTKTTTSENAPPPAKTKSTNKAASGWKIIGQ